MQIFKKRECTCSSKKPWGITHSILCELNMTDVMMRFLARVGGATVLILCLFAILFVGSCSLTGPCAYKGGPASYAQDYVYCVNGTRVELPQSNGNTATYRVRTQ